MNIFLIYLAISALVFAVAFGVPSFRNDMKPKSFKGLLITYAAVIVMLILVLTGANSPWGWSLVVFVTASSLGKTVLYYRVKTRSLENSEVA